MTSKIIRFIRSIRSIKVYLFIFSFNSSIVFASSEEVVGEIKILNSSVYTSDTLKSIVKRYIGEVYSKDLIDEIIFSIEERYFLDGFIFISVEVQNDQSNYGEVVLSINEANFHDNKVESILKSADYAYQHCKKIMRDEMPILRKVLAFCSNTSFSDEKLFWQYKGITAGKFNIYNEKYRKIKASINYNNRASENRGRHVIRAKFELENPSDYINEITLRTSNSTNTNRYRALSGKIEFPLEKEISWWGLKGSASRSKFPTIGLNSAEDSEYESIGIELGKQVTKSGYHKSDLEFQFNAYSSKRLFNDITLRDDDVRKVSLQFEYRYNKANNFQYVYTRLSRGLDIFGAETFIPGIFSDADRELAFTTAKFRYLNHFDVNNKISVSLFSEGQFSDSSLPNAERQVYGGSYIGRGYDPSEISGDHGFGASTKLSYTPGRELFSGEYKLYGYYDYGTTWRDSNEVDNRRRSIASSGFGIEYKNKFLASLIELSKPLTKVVDSREDKDWLLFGEIRLAY